MDTHDLPAPRSSWPILAIGVCIIVVAGTLLYYLIFAAPTQGGTSQTFVIGEGMSAPSIADTLKSKGLIKNETGLRIALAFLQTQITPGGFTVSPSMNAFRIAAVLGKPPYLRWVTLPEGKRKEELADILAKALGWSDAQKDEWITIDTAPDFDHVEGVYFPDTYLIPRDETPAQVAARLRAHFEEVFAPYAQEAAEKNIKWTTALKIASLLEREAAGASDMPLISGIIWNRLDIGMGLDIDATLQYIRGKPGTWWPQVTPADKTLDSPYNTYKNMGLPPHPIDNPGLTAIDAALNPAQTSCLYYLHDMFGTIHCADTYAEHLKNIDLYLR